MIKFWTVFNPDTGEIVSCFGSSEDGNILNNVPEGYDYLEGQSDPQRQVVASGEIVDKPDNVLSAIDTERAYQEALNQALSLRRDRLFNSDWTQVPDAPVDQAAWQVYRQALRDITEQQGFPLNIIWPQPPQ